MSNMLGGWTLSRKLFRYQTSLDVSLTNEQYCRYEGDPRIRLVSAPIIIIIIIDIIGLLTHVSPSRSEKLQVRNSYGSRR